ncbi:branched-chain amino acid ABC transporter permease [Clostridium aminobutyricum]|uniref:Branched-chain amino acid ABC transporter permease n=1 Tax=Clostridium aminobutyricum TaxID=33953 RepID=A0A939IJD7_CLOAM|nr:branched-chain amino acid ABC transporter permease [Clostridium aminobutyricum]MBN7773996.1 branched-chain amino acid ABC transporter permease [Clostridium aminobutyricum]
MLLQQVVNGLTIGTIYALIALGYTMVYGILKIVNFAHGDIFMLGTFIGLFLVQDMRMPIYAALVLSAIITAIVGMIIERVAYRPLRLEERIIPLISALGVSIFLSNLAQKIWGTQIHPFPTKFQFVTFNVGNVTFSSIQILILILSLFIMVGLQVFVKKSKIGIAMQATSMSINNAALMGININQIIRITFAIGSALAAIAGILVGIYYNAVYPTMGYMAGMKAFTAAVLGGIGSIPGAVLGGLILGIAENLGGAYISTQYQDIISFLILIIVLILKPTGILGRKEINKV